MSNDQTDFEIDGPSPKTTAEELSKLGGETFTQAFGDLYAEEDLNAFLTEKHAPQLYQKVLDDPAYGVWVARDNDGAAFGYVVAGPCDLPVNDMPDGAGELMRFYLLQDRQGAGVGGRMLRRVLDWLDQNFAHVYLSVYSENVGAQRLYARYGFEKTQEYFFMVGKQADREFIMKRRK
jgi:ribosomal protein S18 acetylase RimI-like enzyme